MQQFMITILLLIFGTFSLYLIFFCENAIEIILSEVSSVMVLLKPNDLELNSINTPIVSIPTNKKPFSVLLYKNK